MGHGKETPRQKMIGMMYLMLTAMLALNVSKEILDVFLVINEGIVKTNELFYQKNQSVYRAFDKQMSINPNKVKKWKEYADNVKKKADETYTFIEDLKREIITVADGSEPEALMHKEHILFEEIKGKDKTDAPAQVMIGDNEQGKAKDLKKKINEFREYCLKLIDNKHKDSALVHSIESGLNTKDPKVREGITETWEAQHFEHWPLMGTLVIMAGLQTNIRNAEAEMINYLYAHITEGELNFNKLEATVIPNSNYVIKGGQYEAAVFLAARDTTKPPTILIGPYDSTKKADGTYEYEMRGTNYETLPIEEGRGRYKRAATTPGNYVWQGLIRLTTPDGLTISKPFKQQYQVGEATAVVSPTKMNVFYLGLENPVDVSVPGFTPNQISINCTNASVSKTKKEWMITPKALGEVKLTVQVEISKGQRRAMGVKEFRVKPVPDPVPMVAGMRGGDISKNVLAAQQAVIAELPDFLFDLKFPVVSFTLYTSSKGFAIEETANSGAITTRQKEILRGLSINQKVIFENIKVKKPDGKIANIGSISFKVK